MNKNNYVKKVYSTIISLGIFISSSIPISTSAYEVIDTTTNSIFYDDVYVRDDTITYIKDTDLNEQNIIAIVSQPNYGLQCGIDFKTNDGSILTNEDFPEWNCEITYSNGIHHMKFTNIFTSPQEALWNASAICRSLSFQPNIEQANVVSSAYGQYGLWRQDKGITIYVPIDSDYIPSIEQFPELEINKIVKDNYQYSTEYTTYSLTLTNDTPIDTLNAYKYLKTLNTTQFSLSIPLEILVSTNNNQDIFINTTGFEGIGDFNSDNKINTCDLIALVKYIAETNTDNDMNISFTNGDINGDSNINVADLVALCSVMLKE